MTSTDSFKAHGELQVGDKAYDIYRLAAVEGNGERAAAILADAVRTGVDDLSWLHGSAYADLVLLRDRRESLPPALRALLLAFTVFAGPGSAILTWVYLPPRARMTACPAAAISASNGPVSSSWSSRSAAGDLAPG